MAKEDSLEEFWQLFKNASREKQKEILRKIQKASNKSKRLEHITNSLLTASKEGNLEAVTSILEGGFDPNRKGKLGNTPLHMAALGGHLEIVKLLIENGAVLN